MTRSADATAWPESIPFSQALRKRTVEKPRITSEISDVGQSPPTKREVRAPGPAGYSFQRWNCGAFGRRVKRIGLT